MDTQALSLPAGAPLLLIHSVVSLVAAESLLSDLEREDAWTQRVGEFYQYREAGFTLQRIVETMPLEAIESALKKAFRLGSMTRVETFAHSYSGNDFIGLHTDEAVEELRLVVFFNRACSLDQGNFLVFPDRANLDRSVCISPLNNTGVAFVTGKQSEHAVSAMVGTDRHFWLVFRYAIG